MMYKDGDSTSLVKNVINKNQFDLDENPEELIEFIINLANEPLFSNGIKEACVTHGFVGEVEDTTAIKKFIVSRAKEKRIIEDAKEVKTFDENLRNWLKEGVIWKDNPQSRMNIYKICFALDMNITEVEEFFLKKYLYRPFNLRDIHETVYFYAINNSKNYLYAEKLFKKIMHNTGLEGKENEDEVMTCDFRADLESISDENEFIEYCKLKAAYFISFNNTAVKNVNYYIDDNLKLLNCNEISVLLKKYIYNFNEEKIRSSNEFVKQIKKKMPKKISSRFPSEIELSKIKKYSENLEADNRKKETKLEPIGSDSVRKSLILMAFYNYFMNVDDCEDEDENYKGFLSELNYVLDLCGYIQCYARNPYDWIFLYSAKQKYPIETFQAILAEFIKIPNEN